MSEVDPRWSELLEAARAWRKELLDKTRHAYTVKEVALSNAVLAFDPPKRHVFGRVVFEETGDVRVPKRGEWFLCFEEPLLSTDADPATREWPILRPVGLEAGDE